MFGIPSILYNNSEYLEKYESYKNFIKEVIMILTVLSMQSKNCGKEFRLKAL